MKMNSELEKAINRNLIWIEELCHRKERNVQKREELINEVRYNLILSNKNFSQKETVNGDAWVKAVTNNVIAEHINKEKKYRTPLVIRTKETASTIDDKTQNMEGDLSSAVPLEIQEIFEYINTKLSPKDNSIISLHLMNESNASIAEIIGLDERTIVNQISIIKKELKEFTERGNQYE
jgi:RNA polymerase sigma factor (sigma-70 family)